MKVSYNWLRELIALDESPEEVGKMLTQIGLEVDRIDVFESIRGGLAGLVVGETVACVRHPNADRLSLATVDAGEGFMRSIVCGAPNVAAGQKVLVALPGVTLYPLHGNPFVIQESKIRGQRSQGMLCAETEIGLPETQQGIIVLQDISIANGAPATSVYNVGRDYIFEIGLTPNRGDAASHLGIARDLRALTGKSLRLPSVAAFAVQDSTAPISVSVENINACPRYTSVCLRGVTIRPSPPWLQNRLKALGLSPINNVVDVTNYVCHELGQPLHAFDADQIAGKLIEVKNLPAKSRFTTLDGKERTLADNDLMICNALEGMCIAGVLGGSVHGISPTTQNVFLESAYFNPDYIRRTRIRHQIKTDASFRFERGVDPEGTLYALQRTVLLIQETAGGRVASEVSDLYPNPIPHQKIRMKDKRVNQLIGQTIPRARAFKILQGLDLVPTAEDNESYTVSAPPYRVGIEQEADVVEEILRIYGLDQIAVKPHASANYLARFPQQNTEQHKRVLSEMLAANGYHEIISNSVISGRWVEKYGGILPEQVVRLFNASHEDRNAMRWNLLFSGLTVCAYNINRKQKNLKLFEWGRVYRKKGEAYREEERLALYLSGQMNAENWRSKTTEASYFDLAQQITVLLEKCRPAQMPVARDMTDTPPWFEYGSEWAIGDAVVTRAGKIKNKLLGDFGLSQAVFYADFDANRLIGLHPDTLTAQEIPKYPEVRRDLSIIVDQHIPFRDIIQLISETEKKYIQDVIAFDLYEGSQIPQGKKAYGLGFVLLDHKSTLEEKQIDKTMSRLIRAFEEKMQAVIRKS